MQPWWEAAVFYHILVDRFRRAGADEPLANPDLPEFCGGNLRGVIERLDYLRELGMTALLLSPINCTAAYHGYHVTDHADVEARFGGMPAFRALLEAAQPDIRIVMDWVPNHVHHTHRFFQHALRNKASPYRKWFHFDRQGRYRCFLDVSELPKLNLDHPEARRYMIETSLRWLDMGVAGFRLDHVLGPSLDFWREFRSAVTRHEPSAFLVGEANFAGMRRKFLSTLRLPHKYRHFLAFAHGADVTSAVMQEYTGVFDGLLDFEFQRILKEQVAHASGRPSRRKIRSLLEAHQLNFPPGFGLPSLLDNHDMNRFRFEARGSAARLKQAAEIQFRHRQPPIIYYGTEVGLGRVGGATGSHGDLQARQMMPWRSPDRGLLRFYTDLIRQRKRAAASSVTGKVATEGKQVK